MSKIGFVSLGCPKNQIDTEIMLKDIYDAGYEITGDETEADIIIINTCAFIQSAKEEAIENILDVAWLKENAKLKGIIVSGCLVQRYKEEILKELPEVDAVIGCADLHSVVDAIRSIEAKRKFIRISPIEGADVGGQRIITTPEHYAYLKIADGCDNRCAFCAIPDIRGRYRSRPLDEIVEEAKELESLGAKEIILVAQDVTRYGKEISKELTLSKLIRAITDNTEKAKIRLLYCYPEEITPELVEEIRNNDRVIKYVDIPIQHISDRVLCAMRRRGGRAAVERAVAALRTIDGMILRTTLITGFPGESEEDFEELCEFVRKTKFERLGVFPYSREEGTPAYDMDCQIDEETKARRADIIMKEQMLINEEQNRRFVGKILPVVIDGYDAVAGTYFGRSYMDAPEIDGLTYFTGKKGIEAGTEVKIKITDVIDYDLFGEITEEE